MAETLEIIDPLADHRWQSFVRRSPEATIFHHVEWLSLLRAQYRYALHARCVVDDGGEILAGLPFAYIASRLTGKRLVALPFSDLCPLLTAPGNAETATEILTRSIADEHRRSGVPVELRTPAPGLSTSGKSFYHHELELHGDLDLIRSGFHKNPRRDVTRAQREGIVVTRGTSAADLDRFYELHLRTRHRQGVPTQPKRFIRRFERLLGEGLGFVSIARFEEQPVAAAVYLAFNHRLIYKYGASDQAHLKKRPNHAIFMNAIEWGAAQGMRVLDFGRTDLDNEGLRKFKLGWGSTESELAYVSLPTRTASSGAAVPGLARTLISRSPPVTGRLAGAILYRHFG